MKSFLKSCLYLFKRKKKNPSKKNNNKSVKNVEIPPPQKKASSNERDFQITPLFDDYPRPIDTYYRDEIFGLHDFNYYVTIDSILASYDEANLAKGIIDTRVPSENTEKAGFSLDSNGCKSALKPQKNLDNGQLIYFKLINEQGFKDIFESFYELEEAMDSESSSLYCN